MKITRENIGEHLLEYQLSLIGKTVQNALNNDKWLQEWDIDQEIFDEFTKYAITLLKKTFRYNTNRAKKTFDFFNLQFGLKIKSS